MPKCQLVSLRKSLALQALSILFYQITFISGWVSNLQSPVRQAPYYFKNNSNNKIMTNNKNTVQTSSSSSSLSAIRNDNETDKKEQQEEQQQPPSLLVSNMFKIGLTTDTTSNLRLLLASQSPRRREILDMMGLAGRYSVEPSPLNEQALQVELSEKNISPREYARTLAERKAHAMGVKMVDERTAATDDVVTLILGSDTIVDLEGHIMEKPVDEDEAFVMLQRLSGNWHEVQTGVAVYAVGGGGGGGGRTSSSLEEEQIKLLFSFTDTARVRFANLADHDILSYIATKEPMDKAGSYGIQGIGGQLVERMDGDFFTVMGLPMHRLSKELSHAIASLGL